jgi:signal peptidase I
VSTVRSFFVDRRPWAVVIVALLFGPFIGMLYIGRGGWSLFYLALELLTFALPFGLAHAGLFTADPVFTWDVLHIVWRLAGVGHGFFLTTNERPDTQTVWYARWYGPGSLYVLLIIGVELVRWFAYAPYKMPDAAMLPVLKAGDYVLVSKGTYGYSHHSFPFPVPAIRGRVFAASPVKGEIAAFKASGGSSKVLIRRIAGLPGDRVRITNSPLNIVGQSVAVPKGHYFVLGDKRDSGRGSLIPEERLIGRVSHLLWDGRRGKFSFTSLR